MREILDEATKVNLLFLKKDECSDGDLRNIEFPEF